jgi:hypothetical protein
MDAASGPRRHRAIPLWTHRGRRLSDYRRALGCTGAVAVGCDRGPVLEPAAGRGNLSFELRRAGLEVASFDLHSYADPLVHDIGTGDICRLTTLEGLTEVYRAIWGRSRHRDPDQHACKLTSPRSPLPNVRIASATIEMDITGRLPPFELLAGRHKALNPRDGRLIGSNGSI